MTAAAGVEPAAQLRPAGVVTRGSEGTAVVTGRVGGLAVSKFRLSR